MLNGVVIRLLFPFTVRNLNRFFFLVVLCILSLSRLFLSPAMYTNIAPRGDAYHIVRPTRLPPIKRGQHWTESEDENLRNGEEKFRDVGKNDQKWRRVSEDFFAANEIQRCAGIDL